MRKSGLKAFGLRSSAVIAAAVAVSANQWASAATVNWTGATDTVFSTGTNWGGTAPLDNLTTDLGTFAGVVAANQPTLFANRSINGLRFSTATGGWSLGSDSASYVLSVGNGGISTAGQTSGTNTISNNITMSTGQTWSVGTGGDLAISGNIAGNVALTLGTVANAGTFTFSGANTNTANVSLAYGKLVLASASGNSMKAGTSISAGATLQLAGAGGDQIDNTKNLTINGTFDMNARSETINQLASSSGVITNTAAGTSTLTVLNGSVFGGTIQDGGAGQLIAIKTSGQSLTLTGNNSYSGGTQLTAGGTLILGSDTAVGTGTITAGGLLTIRAVDATDRTLANTLTYTAGTTTFGSAITGNLSFATLSGTGSPTFSVLNTKTSIVNAFTANSGTNTKTGAGALVFESNYTHTNSAAPSSTISGGALAVAGTFSTFATNRLAGGQLGRNGTIAAAFNGANGVAWSNNSAGGLFAFGANPAWGNAANNLTANFGGSAAAITWNGTGTGFVTSGQTLLLGHPLSNGTVTLENPLNLNAASQTIQVTRGTTNTAGGADARLNGILSNGGLTKTGDGTLLLSAASTYASGTVVSNGTLVLANLTGSATGSGPVSVNAGTLATGASGSSSGVVTLAGGATIAPGASAAGVLTAGGLSVNGGSILNFGQSGDRIDLLGSLDYLGTGTVEVYVPTGLTETYTLINFASSSASLANFQLTAGTDPGYSLQLNAGSLVVVPEPAAMALFGAAGLLLAGRRRSNRA